MMGEIFWYVLEQQDIQGLHRIRNRLVAERTALVNQIRGLLAEYGIVVAQGIHRLRRELPCILEDGQNELSVLKVKYQKLQRVAEMTSR